MKILCTATLLALGALVAGPAQASLALARSNGCMSCHAVDKRILGPSFRDIGKRYGADKGAETHLLAHVKQGTAATGGKKWGAIDMPPNPRLTDADGKAILRWILSGAK